MGRTTLVEKVANAIRNSVDLTVGNTGYPVLGRYLEEAGIAKREQLRYMEKKGLLQTIMVKHNNGKRGGGTLYKAYYTERDIPTWVTKQQEQKQAQADREYLQNIARIQAEEKALADVVELDESSEYPKELTSEDQEHEQNIERITSGRHSLG